MRKKYYVATEQKAFSIEEEREFFRLKTIHPEIKEQHVEDFLDTTIEWLSSNPHKGILIDLTGVKKVCPDFTVHLARNYEEIKARGLYVRFVNVNPRIEQFIDVSNITVVIDVADLREDIQEELRKGQQGDMPPEKPVLAASEVLADLGWDMPNKGLMKKHKLSKKGLESMFRKLWKKGLISRKTLTERMGIEPDQVAMFLEGARSSKVRVKASDALQDLRDGLTDKKIMRKYNLSKKGLESLMRKLRDKGLLSDDNSTTRKKRAPR